MLGFPLVLYLVYPNPPVCDIFYELLITYPRMNLYADYDSGISEIIARFISIYTFFREDVVPPMSFSKVGSVLFIFRLVTLPTLLETFFLLLVDRFIFGLKSSLESSLKMDCS